MLGAQLAYRKSWFEEIGYPAGKFPQTWEEYHEAGKAGDICRIITSGGSTGMCRGALTKCTKDSDCPSGDTCGPATSRIVIAKRVLSSIVSNNSAVGAGGGSIADQ